MFSFISEPDKLKGENIRHREGDFHFTNGKECKLQHFYS
jgi:hypothetical protein